MKLPDLLNEYDAFLSEKEQTFQALTLGNTALNLMGIIGPSSRPGHLDLCSPDIPVDVQESTDQFVAHMNRKIKHISGQWLLNHYKDWHKDLPRGWENRKTIIFHGKALRLMGLDRSDLIKFFLYAFCDRLEFRNELIYLHPTQEEIHLALPWVQAKDSHPDWPNHVQLMVDDLASEIASGQPSPK